MFAPLPLPLLTREPAAMTQHQKLDPWTIHDTPAQVSDLLNLHEIVAKARQNLNQNDWDYIVGGAESETTVRRNRRALDTLAFRPRMCATSARSMPRPSVSAARCGCRCSSRRSARSKASSAGAASAARPPDNSASPTC